MKLGFRRSWLAVPFVLISCSADRQPPPPRRAESEPLRVDRAVPVWGVVDAGRTPAVVALARPSGGICSGTLVAPDLVLTARSCVVDAGEVTECSSGPPQFVPRSIGQPLDIIGEDSVDPEVTLAHAVARLMPDGSECEVDLALVLLDRPIEGVAPLQVRQHAVSTGERVRAIGFARESGGRPIKRLRDHVPVLESGPAEFSLAELPCEAFPGGVAVDDTTGEIVGILSRPGASCLGEGGHNIYVRSDRFAALLRVTLARSRSLVENLRGLDAGLAEAGIIDLTRDAGSPIKPPKPPKPISDVGRPCQTGADCAAGLCVRDENDSYCSRACGSGDRCPTHFHCRDVGAGLRVCVAT